MSRKIFLITILLMVCITLIADHSSEFPIGEYSGYPDAQVLEWLSEADFNVKRYSINATTNLPNMLSTYDSYGLDMRITDYLWDPDNDEYGTYFTTHCNSYVFQMEFTENDPQGVLTDEWFYMIESENGAGPTFSVDGNALKCEESTAGNGSNPAMAVDYLWKRPDMNADEPLNSMLKYHINLMDTYIFKWNMKWDDNNYQNADEVCRLGIKVKVSEEGIEDPFFIDIYDNTLFISDVPSFYNSTTLTKQNFILNSAIDEYKDFIFTINIQALKDHLAADNQTLCYGWGNSADNCKWKYFCPVVKYEDRGTLYLDYIEIEDNLYDYMVNDPDETIKIAIQTRVSEIEALNTLDNFYAYDVFDEPCPPQFDAYKIVENEVDIAEPDHKLITAINAYGWDSWDQSNGSDVYSYYNAKLFDNLAKPEIVSPDYYLYSNQGWLWNEIDSNQYNIQRCINRLSRYYYRMKTEVIGNSIDRKPFLPIVQTWGQWDFDNEEWYRIMLPPNEQQKMLMYLPLCYGADGLFTFRMLANVDINGQGDDGIDEDLFHGGYGVFEDLDTNRSNIKIIGCINKNGTNWVKMDQYDAVKTANQEIESLGQLIKPLSWLSAGTIDTYNLYNDLEYVPSLSNLESITVEDTGTNNDYYGFIECGEYNNDDSEHYFMLVNRRTNFVKDEFVDGHQYECFDVNSYFDPADTQILTFNFTNIDENMVLLDQYTGTYYNIDDNTFQSDPIEIQPGDGMLLKLCQLPIAEVINAANSCTIENMYIPYDVVVQDGGLLIINDAVEFGPNASLTIEEGGLVIIWGNVLFGANSAIIVEGNLHLNPQNLLNAVLSSDTGSWQGIECYDGGEVWVQNESTIKNAEIGIYGAGCDVHIENSTFENCATAIYLQSFGQSVMPYHLDFISSTINLPPENDCSGIVLSNFGFDHNILITGTEEERSEIIGTDGSGTGLTYKIREEGENGSFKCEYTNFTDLKTGISHNPFDKTMHEFTHCEFDNCDTGIDLFGTGQIFSINNSTFSNINVGVSQNTVGAKINNNSFSDNFIGIDFSNTYQGNRQEDPYFEVHANQFESNIKDIQCSDSTPRVRSCIFNASVLGIVSADNSKVRASYDANNLFNTNYAHLAFMPSDPIYSSGFLLNSGHNDFYNSNGNIWDFYFTLYDGSGITIDADWNWWEDSFVNIGLNPPNPPTIIANRMDENPNVPFIPSPESRFETASYEEHLGNFEIAMSLNRAILDEKLEDEMKYWSICTDNVYNLTFVLEESIYDLIDYFEILYNSLPEYLAVEERAYFQRILKNYQKKCYVEKKEYQSAADIVTERIDNPISAVDSLFAVMQLETIYTLSEMDSTGRGIAVNTKYNHLSPKSLNDHNQKHNDNWNKIYTIMGFDIGDEEEIEQNIPLVPILHNNFPNPFNPETTIKFSIPEDSKVKLTVYNIKGQKVITLVNDGLEKGIHEVIWAGKNDNNKSVASGVYFYKFDVNDKTKSVKKCLMLK